MDPVVLLKSAISLARQAYAQWGIMTANVGIADKLKSRFELLERLLLRVADQPSLAQSIAPAVQRVCELLEEGQELVSEISSSSSGSVLAKLVSKGRRFLKAGTYAEQIVEFGVQLDRVIADMSVSGGLQRTTHRRACDLHFQFIIW